MGKKFDFDDIDIKNDQRIQCFFEYISSNSQISFMLFGFVLTSFVFLFSISQIYSFNAIWFNLTFLSLGLGLMFLLVSCILHHINKERFIKFLFSKREKKFFSIEESWEFFLKFANTSNLFLILVGICFFLGIYIILGSLYLRGFILLLIIFNTLITISTFYMVKMLRKLSKERERADEKLRELLKKKIHLNN